MSDGEYITHEELLRELGLDQEDLDSVEFCDQCGQPLIEYELNYEEQLLYESGRAMLCPECDRGGI